MFRAVFPMPLLGHGSLSRTLRYSNLVGADLQRALLLHLANGTHPKVVQEMLGHATISMTMDTYSHVVPSMQAEAAATMDRLLASKEATT